MRIALPVLVLQFVTAISVRAADPMVSKEEEVDLEAKSVHAWTSQVIGEIDVRTGEDENDFVRLVPLEKPLLKWSTPTVGRVYGDVYVFTEQRRPRVVVSMFEWFHPWTGRQLEWSSVTEKSLRAEDAGARLWQTGPSEAEWRRVSDAGIPSPSAVARLVQMRSVARRFSARLLDYREDEEGIERQLRLLTAPLYRYECPDEGVVDGGLFAFVLGSDPDVLLLIEARSGENAAKPREWRALVARMNGSKLVVELDGEPHSEFERILPRDLWDRPEPYGLHHLKRRDGQ